MVSRICLALVLLAEAGALILPCVRTPAATRAHAAMKAQGEAKEEAALQLIELGAVCEFTALDAAGKPSLLGVVSGAQAKAKGGAKYILVDAQDKEHHVAARDIHIALPGNTKKKDSSPAVILAEYESIASKDASQLGVDPELLEMAWEEVAEEKNELSPNKILGQIDESLTKGPLAQYRAFRLLTSDLGKIFFKTLSHGRYKAKTAKSVRATKDTWCRAPKAAKAEDFCFV
jgi:hypothetical protein